MVKKALKHPLEDINQNTLSNLIRTADRILSHRGGLTAGHHPSPTKSGQGIEFFDYREYVPGDDIRHVDWRLSQRQNRYYVAQYCDDTYNDWYICLGNSASMHIAGGEKWRLAMQLSAAYCYLLLHLGNRVGIAVYSDEISHYYPFGRGTTHFSKILHLLCSIDSPSHEHTTKLNVCFKRSPKNGAAVIISDFLHPDTVFNDLKTAYKRCNEVHTMQVLSEYETHLPHDTELKLQDIENGEFKYLLGSASVQKQAKSNLESFLKRIEAHCLKLGFSHSFCHTDTHWNKTLIKHLVKYQNSNVGI